MSVNIVNKSTGALTKIAGNPVEQASGISYDHTSSGMSATNVQGAVDELNSNLTNLTDAVGWSGHNYLVNDDHTEEKNGVTFTLNADGTWTVDGTATADTVKTISRQKDFTFAGGKLLSGCPNISGLSLRLAKNTSPYTQYAIDSGNGVTIPAQTMDQTVAIIVVENGTHVDNAVVRPMISDNVIPYVPYHPVIGTAVEELQGDLSSLGNHIDFTASNKITVTGGDITKVGNTVFIDITIQATEDINAYTAIISGLPTTGTRNTYLSLYDNTGNLVESLTRVYGNALYSGYALTTNSGYFIKGFYIV